MKKTCIWKAQSGKVIARVIKLTYDCNFDKVVYRVYVGRKWFQHIAYDQCASAIETAVYVSLLCNYNVKITKK